MPKNNRVPGYSTPKDVGHVLPSETSHWSDEKSGLLKILSDQRRYCIIELLSKSSSKSYSLDALQKDFVIKCKECIKPDHTKCKEGCTKPNLCRNLRILEHAGLILHGMGKQDKWFPVPQHIYAEIMQRVDEIDRLVDIGTHVANVFSLHTRIEFEIEEYKRDKMLKEFSHHVSILFEPKNFRLMTPKLTWEVYKRIADLELDFSKIV
jgi:hypothetical protein